MRQAVVRRGVPDQQDGYLAVIVQQAPVDHLVPRRAPAGGVRAEQLLHQFVPPRTVPPGGKQPTVQQHADLRRGARGIGHLLLGEFPNRSVIHTGSSTWDEDDGSQDNLITTIFAGQPVRPGSYAEPITHYSVLATIEAAYALPRDGRAAIATPITDIWRP